jgi:Gpi18-like mannosyltransferase
MKRILKYIFLIFIVSLSIIFFVNKVSPKFIENKTSYEIRENISNKERVIFLPFLNFDGRNYFDLADRGYFHIDNWWKKAFYPMYPVLIKIVTNVTGIKLIYSGLIISWISILLGFFYLYKLVKLDYGENIALKTLILIAAFPTSFYFYTYYTESLFFLLSVLCFYNIRLKNYYIASIIAAFASATRVVGIFFACYLFYIAIRNRFYSSGGDSSPRQNEAKNGGWGYVLIAPLGLIFFMAYFYLNNDSPFAMFSGQLYWNKEYNFFGPIKIFYLWMLKILFDFKTLTAQSYLIVFLEFISYLFSIVFLFFSYKKIKFDYWLYSLVLIVFPLLTTSLASYPRYLLVIFPIQIYIARLSNNYFKIVLFVYLILLLILETLFIRGYWVA